MGLLRNFVPGFLLALALAGVSHWVVAQAPDSGSRRVALVIGNNDYRNVDRLRTAAADARAMAHEFRQLGFEVMERIDLDQRGMKAAMRDFVQRIANGGVGAFYFAGHGVQEGGNNYLLPVDVGALKDHAALPDEGVELNSEVMARVGQSGAKFTLLVIDACRDNPFPKRAGRSIGAARGLTTVASAPEGMVVIYSAGVGQQALDRLGDDDADPNGVFTREFIREMRKPGVEVAEIVRNVRTRVKELAARIRHEQTPAIYIQADRFYLVPPSPVAKRPSPASPDTEAWAAASEADTPEAYQSYLRAFPKGRFGAAARIKLAALHRQGTSAADSPPQTTNEPAAWAAARQADDLEALANFLARYPSSRFAEEARQRMAKLRQTAARYTPGAVFRDCDECPDLVTIPAGSFAMGSAEHTREEGPVHTVRLAQPFALGRSEVTQAQWQALMGEFPKQAKICADCPVEGVSWQDAQTYLARLAARTGKGYRLPSEAEWEYACRAAGDHRYCGGDDAQALAWHADTGVQGPQAVAQRRPNAWGLHDMSGNVWEWVGDCWNQDYEGAPADGSTWNSGQCATRVLRGGSWSNASAYARATVREHDEAASGKTGYGFRVLRGLR
ncbi:MAG: SUMF1/EgtB/PvdO family nonheme iron enzyme [Betaproteobacteria bacterium]|nr:SUMF1/EgtB/PvdO family nonheme iron enzyme [Betaproteobacteria bacterium]